MSKLMNETKTFSYCLIILFLTSVDTVIFGTNSNRMILYVPRILGFISILVFTIIDSGSVRKIKVHIGNMWSVLLMVVIMSLSSIINSENPVTYVSRLLSVLLAYTICQTITKDAFATIFDRFMTIVASFAILTEIVAYVIPSSLRLLPTVTNTANGIFYTYFFGSIQSGNLGHQLIRANGIFWEPGAFSIYLIFAILIQLFILETPNIRKIIIYVIAIIITFSTTGYVTLGVLLITYLVSDRTSKMTKGLKILFVVLILSSIGFIFFAENNLIYINVIGKLTSGTSSATTRYSSLFNGMKVAIDNPVLGVASRSQEYMYDYVHATGNKYSNGGNIIANTIIGWSVNYGLIFGLIFVIGSVRYLKYYSHSVFEWFLLTLTVLMAYSGERFFSFFPFIFVFYGLKKGIAKHENCSN